MSKCKATFQGLSISIAEGEMANGVETKTSGTRYAGTGSVTSGFDGVKVS